MIKLLSLNINFLTVKYHQNAVKFNLPEEKDSEITEEKSGGKLELFLQFFSEVSVFLSLTVTEKVLKNFNFYSVEDM